jgi:acyl-CoA synthetase (AMP-forming)/AMP-acid ligase II
MRIVSADPSMPAMGDDLAWEPSGFPAPEVERLSETLPMSLARALSLWPDCPAVLCGGRSYSFRHLAARAAGIAAQIREAADAPGPVALLQSVGVDAIASWFACALSGRPFLLLEPDHPRVRLRQLMDEAGCALVLVDHRTLRVLGDAPRPRHLVPDDRHGVLEPWQGIGADEPAMIFATSGSTGTPMLVTYSAATLQAKVQSSVRIMGVPQGARVLIASSHGNFGFLHHACVFLVAGGTLCLAEIKAHGFAAVRESILVDGARQVRFTPTMFRKMAAWTEAREAMLALDAVRFSGEPLLATDLELARRVLRPGCVIQNVYGSTESAMFLWSSDVASARPLETTVPIGRIYPLFAFAIRPMEEGDADASTGELWIRSAHHALGDYKLGAVNPARFPLSAGSSRERIYATGDIVRRMPDGSLAHLGRAGRMVKIRGNRVFLAEVEEHLRAMQGITGAAVVAREGRDGPELYGFVTAEVIADPAAKAWAWLAERLPEFMRPRRIIQVPEIPLLPGGKIDHASLLERVQVSSLGTAIEPSRGDDHARLATIWDSVLWMGAHAHDTDFHALGGDSLKLMMLSMEVERAFGKRVPLGELAKDATFRNLARLIGAEDAPLRADKPEGLVLRRAWQSVAPHAGIALGMPGWTGRAPAELFGRAAFFPHHEVWAADFDVPGGTMRRRRRWWRAANEIVDGIRKGAVPVPDVIFGFSFGGGLAWIVSRMLAATGHSPRFVIMVDAVPLHRLRGFRCAELGRALAMASCRKPAATLHIRRASLAKLGLDWGNTTQWTAADDIQTVVELPTVDHLEMAHHDLLGVARESVASFIAGDGDVQEAVPAERVPGCLGVQIYNAVTGKPGALEMLLDGLAQDGPPRLRIGQLLPLLHAIHATDPIPCIPAEILRGWEKGLPSTWLLYARLRMGRGPDMLCPDDAPRLFPRGVVAVEKTFARRRRGGGSMRAWPLRLLCMALDLVSAVLWTAWVRAWRRLSRVESR